MSGGGDVASQVALPNDPDLDADVHDLTLTAVVTNTDSREVLVRAEGGHGRWVDAREREWVDVSRPEMDLSARMPDMPDRLWSEYVTTLERWRDSGVRLRMCSAPGKVTLLIAAPDDFLPFPRRPDPAAVHDGEEPAR